jgi:hypothetical protein
MQYLSIVHTLSAPARHFNKCLLFLSALPLLLLLTGCGQSTQTTVSAQPTMVAPSGAYPPSWFNSAKKLGFSTHGQYIAAEAISIASALYGPQTNQYYSDDPTMAPVIAYWQKSCHNADGSLCTDAKSGNLQCVEFVSAVFAQIDDQLPYGGNADQFWSLYQNRPGWQEIAADAVEHTPPALGDVAVWSGNSTGHMAIVVDMQPPTKQKDGHITIAQSNAAYPFENLIWHTDGRIDSWQGYQLQGFIRQQQIAPCLQMNATPTQQQWETQAIEAAVYYGIPSKYFLQQLCQSGFQAQNGQSHSQGIGIAQLPAQVAKTIPRCVINFLANPQRCDQHPGSLPAGKGIDATQPGQAIPAAAFEMSLFYTHYTGNHLLHIPQDDIEAFKLALAAYRSGQKNVDWAIDSCGKTRWLGCLDNKQKNHDASTYVNTILALKS